MGNRELEELGCPEKIQRIFSFKFRSSEDFGEKSNSLQICRSTVSIVILWSELGTCSTLSFHT